LFPACSFRTADSTHFFKPAEGACAFVAAFVLFFGHPGVHHFFSSRGRMAATIVENAAVTHFRYPLSFSSLIP